MTPSESRSPERPLSPLRKGVLFCPDCTHASPFDGDWDVTETSEYITFTCPACGQCIQRRPVFDRETSTPTVAQAPTPTFGVSPAAVDRWRQVWSSWATAWVQFVTKARSR